MPEKIHTGRGNKYVTCTVGGKCLLPPSFSLRYYMILAFLEYLLPWRRCEMGGLVITERVPAPSYEFEMLNTTAAGVIDERAGKPGEKTLFLHFNVRARLYKSGSL